MLIFSEKKTEVDDIHEYLLLKGVQAVAIHGGKGVISYSTCSGVAWHSMNLSLHLSLSLPHSFYIPDQEERHWSVREFKESRKDVLVATDLASKGMDFANIQHVINYDMPTDIENYGKARNLLPFVCFYVIVTWWRQLFYNVLVYTYST